MFPQSQSSGSINVNQPKMFPQSQSSGSIDGRDHSDRMTKPIHMQDTCMLSCEYEQIDSLRNLLRYNQPKHASMRRLMRAGPSDRIVRLLRQRRNSRKVAFSVFDMVREYEPDDVRQEEKFWTAQELKEIRQKAIIDAFHDNTAKTYLKTITNSFQEISRHKNIPNELFRDLVRGISFGHLGLEFTISKEWQSLVQLDVRCVIASVISSYRRAKQSLPPGTDISNFIREHSMSMTCSHRAWAAALGTANSIVE